MLLAKQNFRKSSVSCVPNQLNLRAENKCDNSAIEISMKLLILPISSSPTQRHIGSPSGGVAACQAVGCTSRDLGFN